MVGFKKSIEFFQDEIYRDLEYGTIYYVAGTTTGELNTYVKNYSKRINKFINTVEDLWFTCKIVYLETNNTIFPVNKDACIYSAILPTLNNDNPGYGFLVATLINCDSYLIDDAFERYCKTLIRIFDEILDTGTYKARHIQIPEVLQLHENLDCICFSIQGKPISGLPEEECKPKIKLSELSRLEITPKTYDILLPDYKLKLRFGAQVKAMYVLFLLHPEGIRMKEIGDYKDEYKNLYFTFTNRSDMDRLRDSIEKLFDMWTPNALNVKKSQCHTELMCAIPDYNIRQYYEIEVKRGRPHKIRLNRKLVSIPESLLKQKSL